MRAVSWSAGPLDGMRLIGFALWERKGSSGRDATFPARQCSVNGERRTYALLHRRSQSPVRDRILQAYDAFVSST